MTSAWLELHGHLIDSLILAKARLEELGYTVLEPPVPFEGAGDALLYDGRLVLAGYRQRTGISAHQ